ncbi:MAG: CsgG/HfaB family protein [bacterium]
MVPRKLNGYIFACIIFFSFTFAILAQSDPQSKLTEAENYYKSAQFDEAIEILNQLSYDESMDIEIRKDALRFLGRACTAKGQLDKAKEALIKLLELEPPMVIFNPDYESPPFMRVYYDSRKTRTGSYEIERPDPGMKTMAIIDFMNSSVDEKERFDPMEKGFADLLIHRLNNATNLKVVERERINWLLNEIEIQDKYSMEGAVRIGKMLGAQTVLIGSFIIFNDEIWLGARLVKVETGEILLTDEIKGDIDEFFDLAAQLSEKIAVKIGETITSPETAVSTETKQLDAILSYSKGLSYLEKGDYQNAYQMFTEALQHDPTYEIARIKAESIKPYL